MKYITYHEFNSSPKIYFFNSNILICTLLTFILVYNQLFGFLERKLPGVCTFIYGLSFEQ